MPRRVSPGADKVNETGEPTLQKIYEPPGNAAGVRGHGRRGAGRPDAQTGRGRTHVDRENRRAAVGLCIRDSIEFQLIFDIASKYAPLFAFGIVKREKNSKLFLPLAKTKLDFSSSSAAIIKAYIYTVTEISFCRKIFYVTFLEIKLFLFPVVVNISLKCRYELIKQHIVKSIRNALSLSLSNKYSSYVQ